LVVRSKAKRDKKKFSDQQEIAIPEKLTSGDEDKNNCERTNFNRIDTIDNTDTENNENENSQDIHLVTPSESIEQTTESEMTSKSKKKQQQKVFDGVAWVVDDQGNKIKKVRKKVRRRSSMGHNSESQLSQFPDSGHNEFGGEPSLEFGMDDSAKKMMSFRTEATEPSSGHYSESSGFRGSSLKHEAPFTPTSKPKSKKSSSSKSKKKNIVEINGDLWRIDTDGNPLNRVRKKEKDRLSQTEHIPETPSKKKKKAAKSKSVKHVSKSCHGYDSGKDSVDHLSGTVNTTGTGSYHAKRPSSSPELEKGRPSPPRKTPSGDLDILMTQSVHDHVRKVPSSSDRPQLERKSSALSKVGKILGKSRILSNLPGTKSKDRDSSWKGEESARSNSDRSRPLPKDIREIDGVLWRVDELGNKLNKVRRKPGTSSFSSGDEAESRTGWSSDNETNSVPSFGGEFSQEFNLPSRENSFRKARRPQQRRNSMGNGKQQRRNSGNAESFRNSGFNDSFENPSKPDSNMSLYLDNSDHNPLKPSRRQSIGASDVEHSSDDDEDFEIATPKKKKNQKRRSDSNLVQNLQHRLRASEKEIARLCRLTMDQADRMENTKGESKKMRDKLKNANRDKQDLINQVHNLEVELDKRTKMLIERNATDNSSSNDNNTKTRRRNSGSSDLLVAQICELEDEKRKMVAKMDAEKAMARSRLESKEEEVRFLQEELERMRAVQGDKQLEYMQKMASLSDDDESLSASKRGLDRGPSLQFVGKILGNHLKDKAETEVALQQQEIRDLQDRVSDLLMSNEKLKAELKRVTLEIKDDDDDEIRRAKEAAAQASEAAARYQPNSSNHLRDKVMSLSRRHRSTSEGGGSVAESFRLNRTSHR